MSERNKLGQFVVGNPGGPGSPYSAALARNKAALLAAVDEDDLRKILRSMIDAAIAGDVQAAKLVLDRVCGREAPPQGAGVAVAIQQTPKNCEGEHSHRPTINRQRKTSRSNLHSLPFQKRLANHDKSTAA